MFGAFYAGTVYFGVSQYLVLEAPNYPSETINRFLYYKRFIEFYGDIVPGVIDEYGYYMRVTSTSGDYSSTEIDTENEYMIGS
jgi:hypothetical protein